MSNEIVRESERRLSTLKGLKDYFNHQLVDFIYLRTEMIHDLFNKNNDKLDISKIDIFHVQFTDSLISLLSKIQVKWITNELILEKEIEYQKTVIHRLSSLVVYCDFDTERKQYSGHFSKFMSEMYDSLTGKKKDSKFIDIDGFQEKYSSEYYDDVEVTYEKPTLVYETVNGYKLNKKLMGRLNKNDFRVRFVCGFEHDDNIYEIFKIFDSGDLFIRDKSQKTMNFYFPPDGLVIQNNKSKNKKSLEDAKVSIKEIEDDLVELKTFSPEVLKTLKTYEEKLENLDIISDLFNYDEETNILKAMLNLNINK